MAYDSNKPGNDSYLADFPPEMREQLRAIISDQIVNALKLCGLSPGNATGNIPVSNGTECVNLNAQKLGGNLPAAFAAADHGHAVATGSSNGFMANTDKSKLDVIASGAEVNQNAFANVVVGATTIQADAKSDSLTLEAGANIALTPDAVNDKVTIAFKDTLPITNGGTGATTAAAVLAALGLTATAAELNTLDGITPTVTELNYVDGATSNLQTQINGKAPTSHASTGTGYGVASAANYGHAMASQATPLIAGTAAVGTDNGKFAREGHVHPLQTSVSGNAATATKLATARTINGVNFDGSANITIQAGLDAATQAQALAGTDDTVAITPLQLRNGLNAGGSAPIYACRAWVNFNGQGTIAIRASGNVSSITDNGSGDYTINFATAMPDTNYAIVGFARWYQNDVSAALFSAANNSGKSASSVRVRISNSTGVALTDSSEVNALIFR